MGVFCLNEIYKKYMIFYYLSLDIILLDFPSLQMVCTLLTDRFHFSAASLIVINSIFSYLNKSYKIRHFTLHSIISAETPKINLNLSQIYSFLPIYTFVHTAKKYTLWLTFILLRHKVYLSLHPSWIFLNYIHFFLLKTQVHILQKNPETCLNLGFMR